MKVKIVNSFKDVDTGVLHGAGEVIEMTEDRVKQVEENTKKLIKDKKLKKGTVLIEKAPEDEESQEEKAEDKKESESKGAKKAAK